MAPSFRIPAGKSELQNIEWNNTKQNFYIKSPLALENKF